MTQKKTKKRNQYSGSVVEKPKPNAADKRRKGCLRMILLLAALVVLAYFLSSYGRG